MKTLITLEKRNKEGVLLEKHEQESRSWLLHFFNLFYKQNTPSGALTCNDITAAARILGGSATEIYWSNLKVKSGPGGSLEVMEAFQGGNQISFTNMVDGANHGIVVGTSNAAVAPNQNALTTKVAHGEAAGTLLHGGTELYGLTIAATSSFKIRRYFTNVLGGDIPIQEVGIYTSGGVTTDAQYQFCIARDVTAAIVVSNTEILEVTYTVQITV
jgi:hypothetical protein